MLTSLEFKSLEDVEDYAFRGVDNVKTLNIPANLKEFNAMAFIGLEKLEKITTNSGWKLSKGRLLKFEDGKSCYSGRITHIVHNGNYTYVYLYDAGNIMTDMSIAKIKQRLSTEFFFLESKMFIVAYSFIRSFDGEKIILKNGNEYKIPRDKIHSFKSGFRNFKIEHMKIYY